MSKLHYFKEFKRVSVKDLIKTLIFNKKMNLELMNLYYFFHV